MGARLQGVTDGHQAKREAGRARTAKNPAKARALLEPTDDLPAEPTARRYVVNDATVEALGELLETNTFGMLVYRDELHGLLCSMDRQGQEGARGFYLTAYDGNQGYTVDRILRGKGRHIPGYAWQCLAAFSRAKCKAMSGKP